MALVTPIGWVARDAVPSTPTTVAAPAPASAPVDADLIEDRWALVFDGGVSLAIWEYGIARELLDAARASDASGPASTAAPGTRLAIYRDAIRNAGHTLQLDITAGTSAGGISGVCLSRALATGGSLEPLESLWMMRASVGQLMKFLHPRSWGKPRAGRSLFSGWRMGTWLIDAIDDLAKDPTAEPHPADLFVTSTDLVGFDQVFPAHGTASGDTGRQNRMVFRFSSADGTLAAGKEQSWALAFAARSTSSFPGAFPASSLRTFPAPDGTRADTGPIPELPDSVRGPYAPQLSAEQFSAIRFADGGLLDNQPYNLVVDAIAARSASRYVRRRIVHVNPAPDSGTEPLSADAARYRFIEGIRKALSVSSSQSIVADLTRVEELNAEIERINAITADLERRLPAMLGRLALDPAAPATWRGVLDDAHAFTRMVGDATAGGADRPGADDREVAALNIRTYQRLKVDAIADMMASDIAQACTDGPPREVVADVFSTWASDWFWAAGAPGAGDETLASFLRSADLPYQERRLRYLISRVNALFPAVAAQQNGTDPDGAHVEVDAAEVARVKSGLWRILDDLITVRRNAAIAVRDDGRASLPTARTYPESYVGAQQARVTALVEELVSGYRAFDLADALTASLGEIGASPALRRVAEALRWYPLWDAAVFPTIALTRLPQLSPITIARFSPVEARGISPTADIEGTRFGHFGAFFKRAWRENDYAAGRVHGVALILHQLGVDQEHIRAATLDLVQELRGDRELGHRSTKKQLAAFEGWAKTAS